MKEAQVTFIGLLGIRMNHADQYFIPIKSY